MVWVSIGTIEQSWAGFGISISGSLAKVVSVSVSTAVSTISVSTISVSAIKTMTITITMTVTMTISSITIVCVRRCFSLWLSNDSRKKGEGENGLKKRWNLLKNQIRFTVQKLYSISTLIKSYLLKNTYDFHHFDYELFEQNPHK